MQVTADDFIRVGACFDGVYRVLAEIGRTSVDLVWLLDNVDLGDEEDIVRSVTAPRGYGSCAGIGDGIGDGNGNGRGDGIGDGNGNGDGDGYGGGYGNGRGDGYGDGYGNGRGSGNGGYQP